MIAITTSSSMRVKPDCFLLTLRNMGATFQGTTKEKQVLKETVPQRCCRTEDLGKETMTATFDRTADATRNEVTVPIRPARTTGFKVDGHGKGVKGLICDSSTF